MSKVSLISLFTDSTYFVEILFEMFTSQISYAFEGFFCHFELSYFLLKLLVSLKILILILTCALRQKTSNMFSMSLLASLLLKWIPLSMIPRIYVRVVYKTNI